MSYLNDFPSTHYLLYELHLAQRGMTYLSRMILSSLFTELTTRAEVTLFFAEPDGPAKYQRILWVLSALVPGLRFEKISRSVTPQGSSILTIEVKSELSYETTQVIRSLLWAELEWPSFY